MYWNFIIGKTMLSSNVININMRCIEIIYTNEYLLKCSKININMRCIEINMAQSAKSQADWLTLTWDVLKCMAYTWDATFMVRLTLTWDVLKSWQMAHYDILQAININMRCIEIQQILRQLLFWQRLTLTWDVLKCYIDRRE